MIAIIIIIIIIIIGIIIIKNYYSTCLSVKGLATVYTFTQHHCQSAL